MLGIKCKCNGASVFGFTRSPIGEFFMTNYNNISSCNNRLYEEKFHLFGSIIQKYTKLEGMFHHITIIVLHLFYKFVTTKKMRGNYGINLRGKGRCEKENEKNENGYMRISGRTYDVFNSSTWSKSRTYTS